jgi:hypothetical protein
VTFIILYFCWFFCLLLAYGVWLSSVAFLLLLFYCARMYIHACGAFLTYFLALPQKVTKRSSRHQTSPSHFFCLWICTCIEIWCSPYSAQGSDPSLRCFLLSCIWWLRTIVMSTLLEIGILRILSKYFWRLFVLPDNWDRGGGDNYDRGISPLDLGPAQLGKGGGRRPGDLFFLVSWLVNYSLTLNPSPSERDF